MRAASRIMILGWVSACGAAAPAIGPPKVVATTDAALAGGDAAHPDVDRDGVLSAADTCPDDPEDVDAYQDSDGCPDDDNDGDGVQDLVDKCPNDLAYDLPDDPGSRGCPGNHTRPYTDGPPGDLDDDGYPDGVDTCPTFAEQFPSARDGGCTDDGDGCPDGAGVYLIACDLPSSENVFFPRGAARLPEVQAVVVDAIAVVLRQDPARIAEVVGYVDDRESMSLAAARAAALVDALIARGVPRTQLAVGDAGPRPAAPPGQRLHESDRAYHRRVTIVVSPRYPRLPGRPDRP